MLLFSLLLAAAASLFGQTATLRGLVSDPTGAVIPRAKVSVTSLEKGWTRTVETDEAGSYVFTQLAPEHYNVTVESAGFVPEERQNVILQVNEEYRIDFSLRVGATQEKIIVQAEAALIQSENANTGAVIDERKIRELPLNGREFWQLAQLSPMVLSPTQGSTLGFRGGFSVAGSPEVNNAFIMDGIDNNDQTTGQPTHRPSVDGIQEFKVLTGIYSAEYGRQSGGQIVITTKSGSNTLHGTAYYFHRNDSLDARNFFTPGALPDLKRHQYGGSAGGPMLRNRTFYFGTWEALRLGEGVARLRTTPTDKMWTGDLSELNRVIRDPSGGNFPGGVIPAARLHATSLKFREYYPRPALPGVINNYAFSGTRTQNQDQFSGRVDHRFSEKDSIYVSYQFSQRQNNEPSNSLCGDRGLPIFSCTEPERTQTGSIVHMHVFSPGLLNELRFGFNRIRTNRFQDDMALGNVVQKIGIPGLAGPEYFNTGVPQITITGYATIGGPTNLPQGRRVTNYNLVDGVTWVRSGHTMKGGVDYKKYLFNSFFTSFGRAAFTFNGQFTGDPFADFLLGGLRQTQRQPGEPFNNIFNFSLGGYFQDDWQVSRKLTLNLGLRYEYNQPILERVNKNASYDPGTGNIIVADGRLMNVDSAGQLVAVGTSSLGRRMWRPDRNNFAPRFGLAWRPFADNRTVIRAGYGIFYNLIVSANGLSTMYRGLPFRRSETFINQTTNVIATWANPFPSGVAGGGLNPQGMNANFPDAYIQQWSFGFERQITGSLVVDASYFGSKGTHLPLNWDINQPEPGPGAIANRRPFRQWGAANYRDAVGGSNFNALALRLEHRFSHGLSMLAAYTLSKSLDYGAPPATGGNGESGILYTRNFKLERGLSEFDTRHRMITSAVYELPFARGNRLLGGWEVSGIVLLQSGRPFTVTTARDISNTGGQNRPNVAGSPRIDDPRPERWFNTAAFSDTLPAGVFAYGNAGPNLLISDGISNFDLSVFKNFRILERLSLQFRSEFFNAFNHANFGLPDANLASGTFGRVSQTSTLNRQIQFGLKLVW
ncbi:MAG: TonB-dependent receptor [Acidobacteria bacterium]|nr:TonB-dependent receptor [Acidobacteriota bacterium]